ncbi:hypothetical protein [Phenylobacterium sp.]|uniref:hypothetical protein n=1 Tax=Phenylobacterium sp. TaxID=1871053 RepID=UPI00262F7426|nr:hypothetical protein [Phenylobacterium sp.]
MSYPSADEDAGGAETGPRLQSQMTEVEGAPAIRLRAAGAPAWDSGVLVVLSLRLLRRLLRFAHAVRPRRRRPRSRLDIRV